MRLTQRDRHILEAIHAYDGMLGFSHIQRLFFTGKSQTEERLKLLYQHGFLQRPDRLQRMRLPEMIYWLDRPGAEYVASLMGVPFSDLGWRKEPRWSQVEHDLAVSTFRLDLQAACAASPDVQIETWIPEGEFLAYPDVVEYKFGSHTLRRRMQPDGFFTLLSQQHRIRYLLEIDRSTEDNPRFFREKILPGLAYIKSQAYEDRFGHRSGRWLVVTTGERRMRNMLQQAGRTAARGLFYFTTYARVTPATLLFSPIWQRADRDEPVPLIWLDEPTAP
jgi:hypothetical protein